MPQGGKEMLSIRLCLPERGEMVDSIEGYEVLLEEE